MQAAFECRKSSLHYNRSRYYNPEIRHFVSQDPFGLVTPHYKGA
ncbi:RHS repeat-associated core domain-containing protein [Cardiobacterium hominis]